MLSPQQIADDVGLSYRAVLRAIEDGEIEAYKLRGKLRVPESELERWLNVNRVQPGRMTGP